MKFKNTLSVVVAALFFVALSFSGVSAQKTKSLTTGTCSACNPQVNSVTAFPFPFSCKLVVFGTYVSSNGNYCSPLDHLWETSDNNASLSVVPGVGGQCQIRFSAPGTYTVTVRYRTFIDSSDGPFANGTYDIGETVCESAPETIVVNVCQ